MLRAILPFCCLYVHCAAIGNIFTAFHKLGRFDGTSNQTYDGAKYHTRRECSLQCTGDDCRYFSIRKHDDGYQCIRSKYFSDDLPEGTWTVYRKEGPEIEPMLIRVSASVEFNLSWTDYENGFGSKSGNYWIGLKQLHNLTKSGCYGLGVNMTDWNGGKLWAYYGNFSVGPSTDKYRLDISDYDLASTAGDAFTGCMNKDHAGMMFSTYDQDNDIGGRNCAADYSGGWWYSFCFCVHPTGFHYQTGGQYGINWSTAPNLPGPYYSFMEFYMDMIYKC